MVGATSLLLGTALFGVQTHQANAETQGVLDELLLPTSYEQYLELSHPSDVAVNERYVAIADGSIVYLYDSVDKLYRTYRHDPKNTPDDLTDDREVKELQFSDGGILYFIDQDTKFFALTPQTLQATPTSLQCSTFDLDGETVYYSLVVGGTSTIYRTTLSDLANGVDLIPNISGNTVFSVCDGQIFYTNNGNILFKYNIIDKRSVTVTSFQNAVHSLVATSSTLYTTEIKLTDEEEISEGTYFVYDLHELEDKRESTLPTFQETSKFTKLTTFGSFVYVIDDQAVRRYSIEDTNFSVLAYEISASSSRINRLNGGVDVCLLGDRLLTADNGNQRISIRDGQGNFQTIDVSVQVTEEIRSITATGETVLVATKSNAHLYDLASKEYIRSFDFGDAELKGAVGSYGKYYFAMSNNGYSVATETDGVWTISNPVSKNGSAPTFLAVDVYGDLYVARANEVYKFSETEYTNRESVGERLCTLPQNTKKMAVDYAGNVYALTENEIVKIENGSWMEHRISLAKSIVYTKDAPTLTAFAFGVEENVTYLLYDGNYVIKTADLALPTVKTIGVENADEEIFSDESAVFTVVQTKANTLLVKFDFNSLKDAEYFPYQGLTRSVLPKKALKIGETAEYAVLAEYNAERLNYDTYLVKKKYCVSLDESEYLTRYDEPKYGYLTNGVYAYKFPYLTELLTLDRFEKNAKIELLGEVKELDYDYYHVSYETENGVKTGYIPKPYVTDFDGSIPSTEEHVLGNTPSNVDSIWRLAYLICGLGAICILTDYLILRKKHKDDEE